VNKLMNTLSRAAATALLFTLAACGGGVNTTENPVTSAPPVLDYTGPAPSSADIQAFRINVWENLKANNRCGQCHNATGQQPSFARNDDVNLAYEQANSIVNLADPANSRMVTKVAGGHNCWLASNSACAEQLTAMITRWAGATQSGSRGINLQPPTVKEAGGSRSFPSTSGLFGTTVHPLLKEYCSRCHVGGAITPQSPYFAANEVDVAYAAARPKINLDDPTLSRLVVRLRDEFHNCWSDCTSNANEMLAAIRQFAGQVPVTEVDPALVLSKALTLYDGTIASGGNRFDTNTIALYEFKTGSGAVAYDTSGVEPALNLNFSGDVTWVGGWGVNVRSGGKLQGTTTASRKLSTLIKATGEYSVEAWVAPGNVVQEDANIISYSGGNNTRNFTLAQDEYNYDLYARSTLSDANGMPVASTPAAARVLQATLQHVVMTYDPVNGRRLYVNGARVANVGDSAGGALTDWDETFALVLGAEVSGQRRFSGVLRLAAIHSRALTPAQVQQNFDAGVGERFYLLFGVSHLIDMPQAYVMFEVSQFDSYSYLFNKPVLISLDPAARPSGVRVKGIRIGLNGTEARVGQAYVNVDGTFSAGPSYVANEGLPLANIGTVVALEKGPAYDQFFLTFDQLGTRTYARTEPATLAPPPAPDAPVKAPDIGLRVFEEIHATMAKVTGVSTQQVDVKDTYERVKQQLPTVENIEGFLASHQVGLAQLSIEYCNALVEDAAARDAYFPGVGFGAAANTEFATQGGRDRVIDPLLTRMLNADLTGNRYLTTHADPAAVRTELNSLMNRLSTCSGGTCPAGRTAVVVKATCAAVLGSATTLVQ
jgi:Concanavalin A-like lectin/glucanases superfamily